MKRLAKFVSHFYPPRWRARYGAEFEALLEEMQPQPPDVLNLFAGAIRMHMTEWSYLKFLVVFLLLGMLAGAAAQLAIRDRFASSGVVSTPSERQAGRATSQLLSRSSLKDVIDRNKLYTSEQLHQPLEDIIETMRARDLRLNPISPTQMSVTFRYFDGPAAQRTVQDLLARLGSNAEFHTLQTASAPQRNAPNRLRIFVYFLLLAFGLGLITAVVVHTPRQVVTTVAIYAVTGAVLAGGASLLIPERYISTATLTTADGGAPSVTAFSDEMIAREIHDYHLFGGDGAGRIPMARLIQRFRESTGIVQDVTPGGTHILKISFVAGDPEEARKVVRYLITTVTVASYPTPMEVLDIASLPESSSGPNHWVLALIGLGSGLLAGMFRVRPAKAGKASKVALENG